MKLIVLLFLFFFTNSSFAQDCNPPNEMYRLSLPKLMWLQNDYRIYHNPTKQEKQVYHNCKAKVKCVVYTTKYKTHPFTGIDRKDYYCFDTKIRNKLKQNEKIKHTYEGLFKNGFYHKGKQTWYYGKRPKAIQSYNGEFLRSKKHGKGIFSYDTGTSFKGQFRDNKAVEGTYRSKDEMFTGVVDKFFNFNYGRLEKENGEIYFGEFLRDKKHGFGKFTDKYGNQYEGGFKDDKYHGKGTFTNIKNGNKLVGNWSMGNKKGFFEVFYKPKKFISNKNQKIIKKIEDIKFSKIIKFEGNFNVDKKEGKGKIILQNGTFFEGNYNNNEKVGMFKTIHPDGKVFEHYYKKNKYDENETEYVFGNRYKNGTEVLQDYVKALSHFKKAAQGGHKNAMLEIAKLYNEDKIHINLTKIQKLKNYFNDGKTKQALKNIRSHMWANLAGDKNYRNKIKINADDVAKAQDLAKECLVKKYKNC